MKLSQVRKRLYEITKMFFKEATVIWAEQVATKPPLPYVTIKTGSISKPLFPCVDEETNERYYPCSTIAEVNLYTKGKPVKVGENTTGNYENTALDDMMEFVEFLESDAVIDIIAGYDLDIQLMPPVRDVSELMNDAKYRYRSMAEFTISYMEKVTGRYGVSNNPLIPNSSGGGTKDFAEAELYVIEDVEIKEETENEH